MPDWTVATCFMAVVEIVTVEAVSGLLVTASTALTVFLQSDARMMPASAVLFDAITEQRITLPTSPELAQHAAGAIAKHTRRGWRIDKPNSRVHIDGIIALCMAVDRHANQSAPAELLGWI